MEFGLDQLRTGRRPFEQVQAISLCRDSSNLVADRFEAKLHYAVLVADLVAELQRAGIWPITHYLAH